MEFFFRAARIEEAEHLLPVYRAAAQNMNDHQIFQWNTSYPTLDIIRRDVIEGSLFILEGDGDSGPVAAITINQSMEIPEIEGNKEIWQGGNAFSAIHRLCVHPEHQGLGLGKRLLREAEELCGQQGRTSLRLMVLDSNRFAVGLYTAMGFVKRGERRFRDAHIFVFMEKIIQLPLVSPTPPVEVS
jgi:ribosomal protein S18 acetylase RimI-like enzyme